jgi:hypothetical protein
LRFRAKPWLLVLLIGVCAGLAAYLMRRARPPVITSDAEMVALLPRRDLATVFLNVSVLRQAGLLNLIQASRPAQDSDYLQFIRDTGFDYARDIERIAARGTEGQIFLLVRGRFDWARLREYASRHGGTCNEKFCQAPTAHAGRWASFLQVQSDMAGIALSADPADVLLLSPRKIERPAEIPNAPLWVSLPHAVLSDTKSLPVPMRLFALALQSADSVVIMAEQTAGGSSDLEVRLRAVYENTAAAHTIRTQLEMDTKLLRMELEREHQHVSEGDLTGLLTSGIFEQSGSAITGRWPLRREFLKALE